MALKAEIIDAFSFRCPACKAEHRRSMWSLAHVHVEQTFHCPCTAVVILPREEYADDE